MQIVTNVIRGGQITTHALRMFSQVFKVLLIWSCVSGLIVFGLYSYVNIAKEEVLGFVDYYRASIMDSFSLGNKQLNITFFEKKERWQASFVLRLPYFNRNRAITEQKLIAGCVFAGQAGASVFVFLTIFCITRGIKQSGEQFNRGAKVETFSQVKKAIEKLNRKRSFFAHPYRIARMPYPYDSEMEHTLVIGSTGVGKTVLISDLVEQIRNRGEKAIIYDKKCDYIKWFYDPKKDIILNPFDKRGAKWNLLAEIDHIAHLKPLSQSFIPTSGVYSESSKIWDEAARIAFSGILEKLICEGAELTNQEIVDLILRQDMESVAKLVKNTYAQATIDPNSPKTAASVLFVLATHFNALRLTRGSKSDSFSIRKWLADKNRDSILFISSKQDLSSELNPLITAWFEIAISGILSLTEEVRKRTWVILDELPTIQKIPSLAQGLSVSRSYGGCFVLGMQNIAQMREVYGKNLSEDISSECNTRCIFKTNDPDTARWMTQNIGESEIMEYKEGVSYGAHAVRDGVNVQTHDKIKSLVLPSEIQHMPKLNLLLKMPDFPITRVELEYKERKSKSPQFIIDEELIKEMQSTYSIPHDVPDSDITECDAKVVEDKVYPTAKRIDKETHAF